MTFQFWTTPLMRKSPQVVGFWFYCLCRILTDYSDWMHIKSTLHEPCGEVSGDIIVMMYRNENAEILYEDYILLTNILKGYYISITQLKIDWYSSSSAKCCLGLWCFTLAWLLFIFHDKKVNQSEIITWIICIITLHKVYLEIKH